MKVLDVYREYKIPRILRQHMLTVAAFGLLICESFERKIVLDVDSITKALLLHDMGNILKFDINVTRSLGVSEIELEEIKATKSEYESKYGSDQHGATYAIANELKVTDNIIQIINNMGSSKIENLVRTDYWEGKIATYADNRIDPSGITTLAGRWDDIAKRYAGSKHKLGDSNEVERRRKYSFELESQVQSKCSVDLQSITSSTLTKYIETIQETDI